MKPTNFLKILATGLVLAAALTSATNAYSTYGRWGTLNVPFYVNPANLDVTASAALSALKAGMSVWNTQSGTSFRFNYAGQSSITTSGRDGRNLILFRNGTSGIASTYAWTSGGLLVESDIIFWDAGTKFFTGTSGCSGGAYIEDIAAHELGHTLGLQHSTATGSTMNAGYSSCSQAWRTLTADDIAGARALYANGPGTPDTPPTVTILSPVNGATVSSTTNITFSGSATDTTDGNISNRLVWRSNISGQIGTGASFSRTLPAGSHTISASVTDSIGYTITRANVLTVTSGTGLTNTAPSVAIASPANGVTVTAGAPVTFSGSASDAQQGNLTGGLVWRSNLSGQIGTGGSFTRTLTAGTHAITASVTDSGGLTTQRGITVTVSVASPPPPPQATLTVTGYSGQGLRIAILVWSGLTAANVNVYRNGTIIGTTTNDSAMTDAVSGSGSYTYKVCAFGTSTCTNQASVTF